MARKLTLVTDEWDDLIDSETEIVDEEDEGGERVLEEFGIDLEDAVSELKTMVDDAVDFMQSEFYPVWEEAQEFMEGATDIAVTPGRSKASVTVMADSVRAIKPNLMRVFLQSGSIMSCEALNSTNFAASTVAEAQTLFANQLFWNSDGYLALLGNIDNCLTKRFGVMKASYTAKKELKYYEFAGMSPEELQQLQSYEDVQIISEEADPLTGLITVEAVHKLPKGAISLSGVKLLEFFIDDAATTADDARVIGEQRNVTVSEARSMGLEYDGDWEDLDAHEVEKNEGVGDSEARRKYVRNMDEESSNDPASHLFLLTEAYAWFDLDGIGVSQYYRFWLGGTNREYIAHERVHENPYGITLTDPVPDSFSGRSMFDVLKEEQNTQTSLMRATLDNAHSANNRRLAVHEALVNMQDVMNPRIGAPIRFRAAGMIQEIGVQSTLGAMLPLMQHLNTYSKDKIGVTNASLGLDPDALQSTDKDAVRNTIQLAQGQIELMARNMAETGLRTVFRKLLRLSIQYNPIHQLIEVNGQPVPLDQRLLDPNMRMNVSVGIGTGDVQTRLVALDQIIMKQDQMLKDFGLNNPVCSINQHMNAICDKLQLMGIRNIGRYFNAIAPDLADQLTQLVNQKAQASQGEPPSKAIEVAETIRAQSSMAKTEIEMKARLEEQNRKIQVEVGKMLMDDDFRRDQMAQDLAVDSAKITGSQVDQAAVTLEQEAARKHEFMQAMMAEASRRVQFDEQMKLKQQEMAQQAAQQQATQQPQQPQQPPQGQPPQ